MGVFTAEEIKAYNAVNKVIPDINNRVRTLGNTEPEEAIISEAQEIFRQQANILTLEGIEKYRDNAKWTGPATVLGVGVGLLALWQFFKGVREAMGWMRRKIAEDEEFFEAEPHRRRIHARDWKLSDIKDAKQL
jgi:hypothetical protein